MGRYAKDTEVSPDRSREEIERTLVRVGEWMEPQIEKAYLTSKMPSFLPMLEHKKEG
jgi:hypothetical protein